MKFLSLITGRKPVAPRPAFADVVGHIVSVKPYDCREDKSSFGYEIVTVECPKSGMRTDCIHFPQDSDEWNLTPGQHVGLKTERLPHEDFPSSRKIVRVALVPAF